MKRFSFLGGIFALVLLLVGAGCADQFTTSNDTSDPTEESSGTHGDTMEKNSNTMKDSDTTQKDNTAMTDKQSTETADWNVYTNTGVSIKYPSDGTYTVEPKGPDAGNVEGFTISQPHPGNRYHITKLDSYEGYDNLPEKTIAGTTYKTPAGAAVEGSGYTYIKEVDGSYYVFTSVYGPNNSVFELMMQTVTFQ